VAAKIWDMNREAGLRAFSENDTVPIVPQAKLEHDRVIDHGGLQWPSLAERSCDGNIHK
jgi:hypothetical protein